MDIRANHKMQHKYFRWKRGAASWSICIISNIVNSPDFRHFTVTSQHWDDFVIVGLPESMLPRSSLSCSYAQFDTKVRRRILVVIVRLRAWFTLPLNRVRHLQSGKNCELMWWKLGRVIPPENASVDTCHQIYWFPFVKKGRIFSVFEGWLAETSWAQAKDS